jgi:septal ring factor EnvC (AmiA/AmiB activator)
LLPKKPLRPTQLIAAALFGIGVLSTGLANERNAPPSPSKAEVTEKRKDLGELRSQIESLRKELSREESRRANATDQLRNIERDISATQRELVALSQKSNKAQETLKELAKESLELEEQLKSTETQLEQLARRRYIQGHPDTLHLLLSGENPNQLARDLYYLGIVGKETGRLRQQTENLLERKRIVAERTRDRSAELATLANRQKEHHEKLVAQRRERTNLLEKISAKITEQRKEIGNLKRDEKQLSQLVATLSKIIAARKAAAAALPSRDTAARNRKDGASVEPHRYSGIANEKTPEALSKGSFSNLRGHLRLPVKGVVSNRFGGPRQEGGTWKGLFIRAEAGGDIKAIASGQVVFAEWMRGFGNLLIIDHGSQYLSIYGYSDSLLKQVGDSVQGGDPIATVGNSGGNPESGLYFELRHQGNPVDPLQWANLK